MKSVQCRFPLVWVYICWFKRCGCSTHSYRNVKDTGKCVAYKPIAPEFTMLLSASQGHVTMSGPWCLCSTHKLLFLNGLLLCDINFMDLGFKPCKWETNACHPKVALGSCLRSLGMRWVYRSCGLPLLCSFHYLWAVHPVLPFLLYWRHLVHHVMP